MLCSSKTKAGPRLEPQLHIHMIPGCAPNTNQIRNLLCIVVCLHYVGKDVVKRMRDRLKGHVALYCRRTLLHSALCRDVCSVIALGYGKASYEKDTLEH